MTDATIIGVDLARGADHTATLLVMTPELLTEIRMRLQSARNVLLSNGRQNPQDRTCKLEAEALLDLLEKLPKEPTR